MNKTILKFILNAVSNRTNFITLGEEIRELQETISNGKSDSILDVILNVIRDTPDNEELGVKIKHIAPLIFLALYVFEEDFTGDSHTE
jgi:hypothetical protein